MKTTNKVLLAASSAIGLSLSGTAYAQTVTIGGQDVAVFDGTDGDQPNGGGELNTGGNDIVTDGGNIDVGAGLITSSTEGQVTIDQNLEVTGDAVINGLTNTSGIENNGQGITQVGALSGVTTLDVTGQTFTQGITNIGNVNTDTLVANGESTTNGITNTGNITTDTLTVTGTTTFTGGTTFTGAVTANGGVNTPTLQNGAANSGAGVTVNDSLTVSGTNATVLGGTLSVGGLATTNGIANTGTITSTGNITTAAGNIQAGTVVINGSANTITGLTAVTPVAGGTAAATTGQLFATNNNVTALQTGLATTNANLAALTTTVNNNFNLLTDRANKAYQGVAMGFASNAAPLNLANGEGGISGGVGYFQGEWAGAVKAQYVTDAGVGLGVNIGFSEDAVGGGVGASIKF